MRSSDTCFSLTHVNSIPQFPPTCHNAPAQTSQINFQQHQPQQQQQSTNQQQPMQCQQYYCYPPIQQGGMTTQNQYVQPYQQDPYSVGQQQQQQQQHQQPPIQRSGLGNVGQPLGHAPFNGPSIMQPQSIGYGSLPAYVLADQARPYFGAPAGPILILPNNCPNPSNQGTQQVVPGNSTVNQGCPGIGINCPASLNHGCPAGSCCPYPVPMPMYNPYFQASSPNAPVNTKNCGCFPRKIQEASNPSTMNWSSFRYSNETIEEPHRCAVTTDETICAQKNCPSAINLQALASQLLAVPGIVSCAVTRLLLRKIPGSEITTSTEETIERAKRSLMSLTKDQLLSETRAAQQVNALINLHMTANPPINVIPILTTLQLKVNLLKAHVDASLNRRLSENQGLAATEGGTSLDPVMIATKTDQELRDLLGTLRQKECDERVNYNFAPYKSQRIIAESRLTNVQNKIAQIEEEMDRRRATVLPGSAIVSGRQVSHQSSDPGCAAWYGYPGDIGNTGWNLPQQNYESPDPFRAVQVRNPKRLNLKPHVGSPETTHQYPLKTSNFRDSSRSTKKDSDQDEDRDATEKPTNRSNNDDRRCCNCDKSSDDDSPDEDKKKRGVNIHGPRKIVSARTRRVTCERAGGVSVVKVSPHVTIVIDDIGSPPRDQGNYETTSENDPGTNSFKHVAPSAPKEESEESFKKEERTYWNGEKSKSPDDTTGRAATSGLKDENDLDCAEQDVNRMESSVHKMVYDLDKMANNPEKIEDSRTKESIPLEQTSTNGTALSPINPRPESLREETVRMITNIHYEPSVFRGFRDGEKCEETVVVKERFTSRPFTEDSSLKSTSTESTVDSNLITESASLPAENCGETLHSPTQQEKSRKNLKKLPEMELRLDGPEKQEIAETESQKIRNDTEIDVQVKIDEASSIGKSVLSEVNENKVGDNIISGALSTIGNHVASFGSLIGKIATLSLHRSDEGSQEILPETEKRSSDQAIASGSGETTGSTDANRKEIGRWKYIRFSDVPESTNTSVNDLHPNRDVPTYTLPKLKHAVIEDKSTGGKYVMMSSRRSNDRRLGEPYKTGRSLVVRSHPKSPTTTEEHSRPVAVVTVPKRKDKNCIALSLADVRSLMKNRSKVTNKEINPSEKFWLKPETPGPIERTNQEVARKKKSSARLRSANDPCVSLDSVHSSNEHLVQIHEYSKIHVDS